MLKLTVYIPDAELETVKAALFAAGAGNIGNYSECCWQVLGCGQFKPLIGSQPYIGNLNTHQEVKEWRVEMVLIEDNLRDVIRALKQTHPYETPTYNVVQTIDI